MPAAAGPRIPGARSSGARNSGARSSATRGDSARSSSARSSGGRHSSAPPRPRAGAAQPPAAPTGALSVRRRVAAGGTESAGAAHARFLPPGAPPALAPPPAWISGALAALQAVMWSFLLVAVPAVAGFVSGAASVTTNATWRSAVGLAADLWLLGHGSPLDADGVSITLVPLGLCAVVTIALAASIRRTARVAQSAWVSATVAYVALVLLIALSRGGIGWRTVLGSVLVGLAGATWGLVTGEHGAPLRRRWTEFSDRIPDQWWPRASWWLGMRMGLAAGGLLVTVASALVVIWIFAGRGTSGDIIDSLGLDLTSGIVLALGQATFVLNLVWWAVAWLSGAGFAVGTGTHLAPGEAVIGPLPALPILGTLPAGDMAAAAGRWAPAIVCVLVAIVVVVLWRRLRAAQGSSEVPWSDVVIGAAGLLTAVVMLGAMGAALSGGAAGSGRLTQVGPDAVAVAAHLGSLTLAVLVVVLVLMHPGPRRGVVRGLVAGWRRVRGQGAISSSV